MCHSAPLRLNTTIKVKFFLKKADKESEDVLKPEITKSE